MNFQYISDIHINTTKDTSGINILSIINPVAPNLIVAGDVGYIENYDNYKVFMKNLCKYFKRVILVPGNHEYYNTNGSTIQTTIKNLLKLMKEISNLVVLNDTYVDIGNVRVYGTPLWSYIPAEAEVRKLSIVSQEDAIVGDKYWMNLMYSNSCFKLRECMIKTSAENKKLVVVTHYAPLMEAICIRNQQAPKRFWYASDCSDLIASNTISAWVYGHTHCNKNIHNTVSNTQILCNQYKDKRGTYIKNKVFTV